MSELVVSRSDALRYTAPYGKCSLPSSNASIRRFFGLCLAALLLSQHGAVRAEAVRAAADGRLDVHANSIRELGFELARGNAEANYCAMTRVYVDLAGERARYLGATTERIELDFRQRATLPEYAVALTRPYPEGYSKSEIDFLEGFVAGYNVYADDVAAGRAAARECEGLPMTRFRLTREVLVAQRSEFSCRPFEIWQQLGGAPPGAGTGRVEDEKPASKFSARTTRRSESMRGSTSWAFGSEVTDNERGLLMTQPHDRWWKYLPVRLTVPGKVDYFAVLNEPAFPQFFAWTNGHIAHAITCHGGQPYVVYRLKLVPGDPLAYLVDGSARRMQPRTVEVLAMNADGSETRHERTYYRSEHGFVLNGPDFPWSDEHAYALHYVSETRPDAGLLPMSEAALALRSTDAAVALHLDSERNEGFQYTIADVEGNIASLPGDAIVNLPDAQWAACAAEEERGGPDDPDLLPILDGSRADCTLDSGRGTRTAGMVGRPDVPVTSGRRAVMASNHSSARYDPERADLTGYPKLIDPPDVQLYGEYSSTGGRWRAHRRLLLDRYSGDDGYPGTRWSTEIVLGRLLDGEGHWAQLLRDDIVEICRAAPRVALDGMWVDLRPGCDALARWDLRTRPESRGGVYWRFFLSGLMREAEPWKSAGGGEPGWRFFVEPYDLARPYETPRGIVPDTAERIRMLLAQTTQLFARRGVAPDVSFADAQRLQVDGRHFALPGCMSFEGCENVQSWDDPLVHESPSEGRGATIMETVDSVTYAGGNVIAIYAFDAPGSVRIRYGGPTSTLHNGPASSRYAAGAERWAKGELFDLDFKSAVDRSR